jgi:hypothetical protein
MSWSINREVMEDKKSPSDDIKRERVDRYSRRKIIPSDKTPARIDAIL